MPAFTGRTEIIIKESVKKYNESLNIGINTSVYQLTKSDQRALAKAIGQTSM